MVKVVLKICSEDIGEVEILYSVGTKNDTEKSFNSCVSRKNQKCPHKTIKNARKH